MSKRSRAADNDEDRAHGDTARADKQHKVGPTVPAHSDFSVGWVCALSTEQTAATAMLDHQYDDLPKPPNDPNCYTLGSIGKHKVVIACLPEGETGTDVAASTVPWMISTFPSIRFALMVGIGGGIPPKVRLGDIVVSTPAGQYPGVVQWDSGKAKDGGKFERTGALNNPPASLRTALAKLKTAHEMYGPRVQEYLDDLGKNYPKLASRYLKSSSLTDVLFKRDYARVTQRPSDFKVTEDDDEDEGEDEPTCRFCDRTKEVTRKPREMRVHYGVIASGNQIIKDSAFRDRLNDDLGGGVLCVEMEAAGLMNNFPCIVIRGICDYADSHKNKYWQPYAAAVAAAFAKELLQYVQATDLNAERPAGDILNEVLNEVDLIRRDVTHVKAKSDSDRDLEGLDWLTPVNYGLQQSDYLARRQQGTGQWLLDSEEFKTWLATDKQTLFCAGIPGAGKTILASIVIDYLSSKFFNDSKVGLAYIYCNFQRQNEQRIDDLLASLLKQLAENQNSVPESVRELYQKHKATRTRPSLDEVARVLGSTASLYSRIFIVVDALDECQASKDCRTRLLSELFSLQKEHRTSILATSRPISDIMDCFSKGVSLEIRASAADVERYLDAHISQLPSFVQHDTQLQEEITVGISKAVDGMFLLAQIYMNFLSDKMTRNDIKSAMNALQSKQKGLNDDKTSEALHDAYDQTLERINGQMPGFRKLAMNVLLWLTCARRQLSTVELQHAIGTKSGKSELDHGDLPQVEDMVSVCAGLVTVDKESDLIRLAHYTTQEYFEKTQVKWFPDAEYAIATTCIAFLSFSAFESGVCTEDQDFEERIGSHPLYVYAARNWGYHAHSAVRRQQLDLGFLECQEKVEASTQVLMATDRYKGAIQDITILQGLHLAAYFGLVEATSSLLSRGQVPDQRDTAGRTSLWYAAQAGHVAVVEVLLAAGADVDADRTSDGNYQVLIEDEDSIEDDYSIEDSVNPVWKLLMLGAGVHAASNPYKSQTALHVAASGGHLEVVEKLLAAGADINAATTFSYKNEFDTVLQIAAEGGFLNVVDKLLAAGADANADATEWNALQRAAKHGHIKVVEKLLAAGANVNADASMFHGRTALQAAAEGGYFEVVEKLIAAGADVNAAASTFVVGGVTALGAAAGAGHLKVVEKLLIAGSDVNAAATSNAGVTALHRAAAGGYLEVVQWLLEAGADAYTAVLDLDKQPIYDRFQIMKTLSAAMVNANATDNK